MDCREFRNKHVPFVDDLLSSVDMRAMYQHRASCQRCSKHDTMIRRSLLIVRNLPPIEPSSGFMARLNDRIEQLGPSAAVDVVAPRPYLASVGTLTALAAGVAAVAYMAIETRNYFAPGPETRPVPLVASIPALEPAPPIANAAFVASVPTGMPVWPAVLMMGQTPVHFAGLEQEASLDR